MKTKEIKKSVVYVGPVPVDFCYKVEQEITLDDGQEVNAVILIPPTGEMTYAITKVIVGEDGKIKFLENYRDLKGAKKSKYYDVFKELDIEIDKLIKINLRIVDDTKYWEGGIRFGLKVNSEGLQKYVEAVGYVKKENKYIYLQVIKCNDNIHYSITDKSIFLRMELGYLYGEYYDSKEKELYYVNTDSLEDLGEYSHFKENLIDMVRRLDKKFKTPN